MISLPFKFPSPGTSTLCDRAEICHSSSTLSLLYCCANRDFLLQTPLIAYQFHSSIFYLPVTCQDKLYCPPYVPELDLQCYLALSSNKSCRLFKDSCFPCICVNPTLPCNLCRTQIVLFTYLWREPTSSPILCSASSSTCTLATQSLSRCSLKLMFLIISWYFSSTWPAIIFLIPWISQNIFLPPTTNLFPVHSS